MSVKYVPVTWNRNKLIYDFIVLLAVALYLWLFLRIAPEHQSVTRPIDGAVLRMQAFGSCAFLLLTFILMIGPLARLDRRFLPLLYNRRHLGVITCAVAAVHISFVLGWYFNFSPTPQWEGVLTSNTAYGQLLGFPFEALGLLAFGILLIMAVTSHDFWLSFLTPPVWKALHMGVYLAFVAVVFHVALGKLQSTQSTANVVMVVGGVLAVCGLHAAALWRERGVLFSDAKADDGWLLVGNPETIPLNRAAIVEPQNGERIAVFHHDGKLSAVSNVCAHQNGPLGEGKVIDGCITCPWHGFQYRPEDGCAPAPFTERISTYNLRLIDGAVWVDPMPNPPGTRVEPLRVHQLDGAQS